MNEDVLYRLKVLLKESNCHIGHCKEDHSSFDLGFKTKSDSCFNAQRFPGANFVWLTTVVATDSFRSEYIISHLADVALGCRRLGCNSIATTSEETINIEIGLSLYFSCMQYYALNEMLETLSAAQEVTRTILGNPLTNDREAKDGHP